VQSKDQTVVDNSGSDKQQKTSIAPMLSVRNGAKAIDFYKAAFGATILFRIDDNSGAVVAQLAVDDAEFWVADESPEHANFSPESLGGGSVRMIMTVGDPDAAFDRSNGRLAGQQPVRLAFRTNCRSVRPPLGNRQAFGRRSS
jgi:hypothetical protein